MPIGKPLLSASALLVVLSTSAFAADLPTTKGPPAYEPPPPPVWNWSGPYVGISGGWGWGRAEHTDSTGFDSGAYNLNGGIVGGTLGYNWQMNGLVVGLEGDGSGSWIRGATPPALGNCGGAPSLCSSQLDALGTVRGRVGFTYDRFMPYLTGGAALGDIHGHEGDVLANGAVGDGSNIALGWTLGVGVEAKIAPQWSAKLEYLYVDLGNHAIFNDTIPGVAGTVPQHIEMTNQILRAGLNYQFDMFAPPGVAAKY